MADAWRWFTQHGFDLLSAVGIIAGLGYTAASFRADTKSRRLSNLVNLTQQHRDIWEDMQTDDGLRRVIDPQADLYTKPITPDESQFVVLVILHIHCWYRAILEGEVRALEGFTRDLKAFFSLPIPAGVWREKRVFYDSDFAAFVERAVGLD